MTCHIEACPPSPSLCRLLFMALTKDSRRAYFGTTLPLRGNDRPRPDSLSLLAARDPLLPLRDDNRWAAQHAELPQPVVRLYLQGGDVSASFFHSLLSKGRAAKGNSSNMCC